MHNFISSGFVTLGRGHLKAQQSIDESGQMSWQGDLDIPISYGMFSKHFHLVTARTQKGKLFAFHTHKQISGVPRSMAPNVSTGGCLAAGLNECMNLSGRISEAK
ncbi:hypothetical protein XENOCAPTIV_007417 [Xenoophorus captivus]|uniref:Uncharacterized protein n=1 Tax=Xenoophorus captivus TaxID=1517983 RepID=A0ABV0QRL7_9TELE